jgi:hypothetical protein
VYAEVPVTNHIPPDTHHLRPPVYNSTSAPMPAGLIDASPYDAVPADLSSDNDAATIAPPTSHHAEVDAVPADLSPSDNDAATIAPPTSHHAEVPADLSNDTADYVVVDCCFAQHDDLSRLLVERDQLRWILGDHMVNWIARPIDRDKLVTHDMGFVFVQRNKDFSRRIHQLDRLVERDKHMKDFSRRIHQLDHLVDRNKHTHMLPILGSAIKTRSGDSAMLGSAFLLPSGHGSAFLLPPGHLAIFSDLSAVPRFALCVTHIILLPWFFLEWWIVALLNTFLFDPVITSAWEFLLLQTSVRERIDLFLALGSANYHCCGITTSQDNVHWYFPALSFFLQHRATIHDATFRCTCW